MTTRDEMDALAASMTAQSKQLRPTPTEEPTMTATRQVTIIRTGRTITTLADLREYAAKMEAHRAEAQRFASANPGQATDKLREAREWAADAAGAVAEWEAAEAAGESYRTRI